MARHLGRRRERVETGRSSNGRGAGKARDAAGHGRIGARVRWRSSVLLRRWQRRQNQSHPSTQFPLSTKPRGLTEAVREQPRNFLAPSYRAALGTSWALFTGRTAPSAWDPFSRSARTVQLSENPGPLLLAGRAAVRWLLRYAHERSHHKPRRKLTMSVSVDRSHSRHTGKVATTQGCSELTTAYLPSIVF